MRSRVIAAGLVFLLTRTVLSAQVIGDVIGVHDLGPGSSSPITGARPDFCVYCHAPHSGLNIGLWNQKLTKQVYTTYTSDTETNKGIQPTLGYSTNQCLSCHDGTVAVGTTVVYGQVVTHGSMYTQDVFGSNMQTSHPFSLRLPLQDNIDLAASLVANHTTEDTTGAVKLINGNVECISCHNPHVQAKDRVSLNFLVRDSSSGQMCLACHDPTRTESNAVNPLVDWATSAHALSSAQPSAQAQVGNYGTVAQDACIGCHAPHNAGAGTSRLLRGQNEQDCIACHNGANVSSMPAYANVFSEYGSTKVFHPLPTANNPHDANEPTLLNNNRHATCVDCHDSHASQVEATFTPPPALRLAQKDIAGISESDGISVLTPAVNQYQNCLRCHGQSQGEQTLPQFGYFPNRAVVPGNPLNVIPQFVLSSTSSHPVMHTRDSTLPQPSLLPYMLNLDGKTQNQNRSLGAGTQIFCTDCHNSDDNREFGGNGPNGPHGSIYPHILERQYKFNTAVLPGKTVSNLYPNPDLSYTGPYAICGKCHNLSMVTGTAGAAPTWKMTVGGDGHNYHVTQWGFSCSVCHTAHGMGSTSGAFTGERLINFDMNVAGTYSDATYTNLVSYDRATDTCVLVCHNYAHKPDGTVVLAQAVLGGRKGPIHK